MTNKKKNTKHKGSKRSLSTHEASVQLNYEVRDLLNSGYTPAQIDGVLDGEYTLEQLLQMPPGNTRTLK
jgi:hypothetical protein